MAAGPLLVSEPLQRYREMESILRATLVSAESAAADRKSATAARIAAAVAAAIVDILALRQVVPAHLSILHRPTRQMLPSAEM